MLQLVSNPDSIIDIIERYDASCVVFIVDENTLEHCFQLLHVSSEYIIQIPAGEESKSWEICQHVCDTLLDFNIDRNGLIVNLGGGVVTDLGGFVASIYKRGIRFINIPTSLLGMVDAAVGGKTGINQSNIKNSIGTFHSAETVLLYAEFLQTLSLEELKNGWVEAFKHGLLDSKTSTQNALNTFAQIPNIDFIHWAGNFKMSIVDQDEKEAGLRKILNLGHTIGHAIEAHYHLPHGFSVLIGMWCEISITSPNHPILNDILYIIAQFDVQPPNELSSDELLKSMRNDKKNINAEIHIVDWKDYGDVSPSKAVSQQDILNSIDRFNAR